jgi:predicted 3-demethylubiquinone-9 3-methyltransferase (glyoxalase superfamily)
MIAGTLDGRPFQALNGGISFPFTEAVSLSIDCADQAEVDRYWDALIADGGKPVQCGWLKDKYGLSWQVVPRALIRLQQEGTPEQVGRMFAAMMPMVKLDVAALEAAFNGEDQ